MNDKTTNASKFITIYNEIDVYMRKFLKVDNNVSHVKLIKDIGKRNKIFRNYKDELISFADLRNLIVHNPNKRYADPIFEPHDNLVKYYHDILDKINNPPLALNTIAIRANDIYKTTLDSNAIDVIQTMNKNTYTHVPVVEDEKIIGVFSENTVLSYIADKEEMLLINDALIKDFLDFIPFDKHGSEYFEFVSKDTLVFDIEDIFKKGLKNNKRIATVFITENGSENEKLLGLVTAWDVAGYDNR